MNSVIQRKVYVSGTYWSFVYYLEIYYQRIHMRITCYSRCGIVIILF